MSITDVLTKTLNNIHMTRSDDFDMGCHVYKLWDARQRCLLDQWKIYSSSDFSKMEADLKQIYEGGLHENASA